MARLRTYVCGITPYDTTHLGHAFTFAWVDTLARVMDHVGAHMQVCRNITDVDDDLLAEARRRNEPWQLMANQWLYQFEDDMRKLHVRRPAFEPLSRDYITEVIFLILALIEKGAAYERDGTSTSGATRWPPEPASTRTRHSPSMRRHTEIRTTPRRSIPSTRWCGSHLVRTSRGGPARLVRAGRDGTSSVRPWPPRSSGWPIDIHAGGEDLVFPHHTYESAMAEAATGVVPYTRAWMHMGTVRVNGEKMAKSTGNLVFLRDLLEQWEPEVIRLMLLDRSWADSWNFSQGDLDIAASRLEQLRGAAAVTTTDAGSAAEVCRLLVEGQHSSAALDLGIAERGEAARQVGRLLGVL